MLIKILETINLGGITIYPLILLGIIALALIIDKIIVYKKFAILPQNLLNLIETYQFSWNNFEENLKKLPQENCYRRFFMVILQNKKNPIWWLESRAVDEAKQIEKSLTKNLWALETIVTAAPLLGLLGTIIGMMQAFRLIGNDGLLNPTGVTAGVAEALIATALGIFIALFSLFAFNYFSKFVDQTIEDLERLGTKTIDHIKLDI